MDTFKPDHFRATALAADEAAIAAYRGGADVPVPAPELTLEQRSRAEKMAAMLKDRQFTYLTAVIGTYVHGSEPLTGRGARQAYERLERLGLVGILDFSTGDSHTTDEVAVTDEGLDVLVVRRADLDASHQFHLTHALESSKRAGRI